MTVTNLAPGRHDLVLVRGDSATFVLTFTDDDDVAVDLSGFDWLAQVRETYDATDALMSFDVDTADAADGILTLDLDADEWPTEASPVPTDKWRWDLEGTDGAMVRTYLGGTCKVLGDVSRLTS